MNGHDITDGVDLLAVYSWLRRAPLAPAANVRSQSTPASLLSSDLEPDSRSVRSPDSPGCYLRQGKVYVPVQAKTEAGFYMDIEPVEVAAVPDTEGLRRALLATYARGNPRVPTPARNERSKPVVLRHAGVKSWARFAHNADVWQMDLPRQAPCRYGAVYVRGARADLSGPETIGRSDQQVR